MLDLSDKWPLFSPQSVFSLFVSLFLNMSYKASHWKKPHLTLQLCCLGLQSCQITSKKAQFALALQKEDFPGTEMSNTDDSVNSKASPQISNHPFLVPQLLQLLLVSQKRSRTQMFTTFIHWMPHHKSAPCLNQERTTGITYCSAHGEKGTRSRISSCSWKERENKKLKS